MAQVAVVQDIVIEDVLKTMGLVEGASEYLVLNVDGIPIKKSAGISAERALHIAFLIQDYWATTKKVIQSDLKMADVEEHMQNLLKNIRIRTSKQKEIIIIQAFCNSFPHSRRSHTLPCPKLRA